LGKRYVAVLRLIINISDTSHNYHSLLHVVVKDRNIVVVLVAVVVVLNKTKEFQFNKIK